MFSAVSFKHGQNFSLQWDLSSLSISKHVGIAEMHSGLALVGSLVEAERVKEENTDFSLEFLPYCTEYVCS